MCCPENDRGSRKADERIGPLGWMRGTASGGIPGRRLRGERMLMGTDVENAISHKMLRQEAPSQSRWRAGDQFRGLWERGQQLPWSTGTPASPCFPVRWPLLLSLQCSFPLPAAMPQRGKAPLAGYRRAGELITRLDEVSPCHGTAPASTA